MKKILALKDYLCDPVDKTDFVRLEENTITFNGGNFYKMAGNIPILLNEDESLFSTDSIIKNRPTTQRKDYHDTGSLKNRVRKNLPSLQYNENKDKRFKYLSKMSFGEPVLILGSGLQSDFYNKVFKSSLVINTDVHAQFGVDFIIDGHNIPFKDNTFGLVSASDVLEHTMNPWVVGREIERVVKREGLVHIEVPFCFPYHGQPYDFFRFTPGGLRILFPNCSIEQFEVTAGNAVSASVFNSALIVEKFSNRYCRQMAVFSSRFLLFWMKYLDKLPSQKTENKVVAAKGISLILKKDDKQRSARLMLEEIKEIIRDK